MTVGSLLRLHPGKQLALRVERDSVPVQARHALAGQGRVRGNEDQGKEQRRQSRAHQTSSVYTGTLDAGPGRARVFHAVRPNAGRPYPANAMLSQIETALNSQPTRQPGLLTMPYTIATYA